MLQVKMRFGAQFEQALIELLPVLGILLSYNNKQKKQVVKNWNPPQSSYTKDYRRFFNRSFYGFDLSSDF
jgi:hypothetical protein